MTILTVPFTLPQGIVLFLAAVLGGALNSVAGGGSFLTFPALLQFGSITAKAANATSTVALWPGSLMSVAAYRGELGNQRNRFVLFFALISLAGGLAGALVLLRTPEKTFNVLVPWLLLLATLLFTYGGKLATRLRRHTGKLGGPSWLPVVGVGALQFVIAVYGGFFGAGIGILMLATLALLGLENIHDMNAIKTVMQGCINGIAVITFIAAGVVAWPQAIVMLVGAMVGGYFGASLARRLAPKLVRRFVMTVAFSLTIYFFFHTYAG